MGRAVYASAYWTGGGGWGRVRGMEPIADIEETREGLEAPEAWLAEGMEVVPNISETQRVREALEAWLEAYSEQEDVSEERFKNVIVQLAHRSAMRYLPLYLNVYHENLI